MPRTTTSKKSPAKAKTTGSTKTSHKIPKKTSATKENPPQGNPHNLPKQHRLLIKSEAKARKPRTSSSKKAALTLKKMSNPMHWMMTMLRKRLDNLFIYQESKDSSPTRMSIPHYLKFPKNQKNSKMLSHLQ